MPCSRQRLNSWHKNGDRMSTFAFSNHVGSRSERHCLLESESMSFTTSAGVIGRKAPNEQLVRHSVKNGGSAPAVAVRTPVTLSLRWRCMSVASMSGGGGRPRPNSSSKDLHSRHGCDWSASTRSVQIEQHNWIQLTKTRRWYTCKQGTLLA